MEDNLLENEEDNVCRTCAFTGPSDYYNVNENFIQFNSSTISLKKVVEELTQIQIEAHDQLSKVVCTSCKSRFLEFYYFKRRCKTIQSVQSQMGFNEKKKATQHPKKPFTILHIENEKKLLEFPEVSSNVHVKQEQEIEFDDDSVDIDPFPEPFSSSSALPYAPRIFPLQFPPNFSALVITKFELDNVETLEKFLDFEDAIVMHIFRSNGTINDIDRSSIAKNIMRSLFKENPTRTLKRQDFEFIAGLIVQVFREPEMLSTYFSYETVGGYSGKLYTAYTGLRAKLKSAGMIQLQDRRPRMKRKLPAD